MSAASAGGPGSGGDGRSRPRGWLTAPERIAGVDLARGLAVLGMLAAHLLTIEPFRADDPSTWADVANGRSSVLFALLAGVSIGLVTGARSPLSGEGLRVARGRLAVRAAMLWVLGVALIATSVPVYVILPAYAILFLLCLPLLTLRAPQLWMIAGATALVMPWVQPVLDASPLWSGAVGGDLALLVGWHYPFPVWFAFITAGLAIGRSELTSRSLQVGLAAGGAGAAALGYGLAAYASRDAPGDGGASAVWTAQAHSNGILEVIGSGGFAIAALGVSLLVCRTRIAAVLIPIRAVGAMPLTAYTAQIVVWVLVAAVFLDRTGDLAGFRALQPWVPFALGTVAGCTAWAFLFGRGPLESLFAWVARRSMRGRRPRGSDERR